MLRRFWFHGFCWTAALCLLAGLTGCSGCRRDPIVERKKELDDGSKKKEVKRREDFEIRDAMTIPGEGPVGRPIAKPGHWTSVAHQVRANNFDFQAHLHCAVTDAYGNSIPLESTLFDLVSSRPAPLPKGQMRVFETVYFVPRSAAGGSNVWLNRELRASRGGRLIGQPDRLPVVAMEPFQYYLVVLAGDPDRYGFLKRLTTVEAPSTSSMERESLLYYRVLLPKVERLVPLPSSALTYTTVACIVWDDVESGRFTPRQQEALLDWLHWGGQLIISGPESLPKLEGSFLQPYLPVLGGTTRELRAEDLADFNRYWSIPPHDGGEPKVIEAAADNPLIGVHLRLTDGGNEVPHTGGLAAERRVGRGRIVVTGFSLTDRRLVNWPSFDSFFNAALLRRPRRSFHQREYMSDTVWADFHPLLVSDSRLVTTLRYFTRDIGHFGSQEPEETAYRARLRQTRVSPPGLGEINQAEALPAEAEDPKIDDWHFGGFKPRRLYGMAAWNGHSGATDAARESLRDAAGISIPRGEFVLQVLAVYLLVLAPLNWGLFRLMGRVEWAWLAAPLIALVGAFAVIRYAQLDIGFARSISEIGIVEMQPGHPRAHVTRYSALYTSLSTSYALHFDDTAAVAQPLGATREESRGRQSLNTVALERDRDLRLTGFRVPSNKTGIMHVEQYVPLGTIDLLGSDERGWQLRNGTELPLRDAGVLRRSEDGRLMLAWVGELASGTTVSLTFREEDQPHFPAWDESPVTRSYSSQVQEVLDRLDSDGDRVLSRSEAMADLGLAELFQRLDQDRDGVWSRAELLRWCRRTRAGKVSLGELVELASRGLRLGRGEARLVSWTDQPLPGMTVRPGAAQSHRRQLVLAHLRHAALPEPQPDVNLKVEVTPADEAEGRGEAPDGPPGDAPQPAPLRADSELPLSP